MTQNQDVARLRFDLIPLPVGFVCGIAFLYVMGVLLRWTGNRLGGSGPDELEFEAPSLGEHNESVLTGLLGYSRERIDQLLSEGVLYSEPN